MEGGLYTFGPTLLSPRGGGRWNPLRYWLIEEFLQKPASLYSSRFLGFELWMFLELEEGWAETSGGHHKTPKLGRSRNVTFNKADKRYSLSYYFPRTVWMGLSESEFNVMAKSAVDECFAAMFAKAMKDGVIDKPDLLQADYKAIMDRFLTEAPLHPYKKTEIWESDRYLQLKREGKL